jgi:hypothetical protein
MKTTIILTAPDGVRTLGMRASATPFREQAERLLKANYAVTLDFAGIDATQGFLDELVGQLVIVHGRKVLSKLSFQNCTDDVKAIIRFVINDRVQRS